MVNKKLSKSEIDSRVGKKHHLTLNHDDAVEFVFNLPTRTLQDKCFKGTKTTKPLSILQSAGLLTLIPDLEKSS